MASRTEAIEALKKYFKEKGRVLNHLEYARETDTPIRIQQLKAYFGPWKNVERLTMATEDRATPSTGLNVDAVLKARNDSLLAAANQWKEASEDQDAKARREAEAQVVAEVLAKNAATATGANANKIAIGGKLPNEQQDFSAMGATVQTDPQTLEQTVVDPKPEVVTTANEDPRTPLELRDAVAADGVGGGNVPTDERTSGETSGQASFATASGIENGVADKDKVEDKKTNNTSSTENVKTPNDKK